jgi:hypothetical protein
LISAGTTLRASANGKQNYEEGDDNNADGQKALHEGEI